MDQASIDSLHLFSQSVLGVCCIALAGAVVALYRQSQTEQARRDAREDAIRKESGEREAALRGAAEGRERALREELAEVQEKRATDAQALVRASVEASEATARQIDRLATAVAEGAETGRATVAALARFEGRLGPR